MSVSDSSPGSIALRGLRCTGADGEPLLIDVSAEFDLGAAAESDAYADTIDLAELASVIRKSVAAPRVLLETVAVQAAREVLRRFGSVETVRLRLAKPEPEGLNAAEEAVEVHLSR